MPSLTPEQQKMVEETFHAIRKLGVRWTHDPISGGSYTKQAIEAERGEVRRAFTALAERLLFVPCPTCENNSMLGDGVHRVGGAPCPDCGGTGSISRELAEVLELAEDLDDHSNGIVLVKSSTIRDWALAREEERRKERE